MKRILLSFAVITALLASCNMNVADVEEPRVKADSTAIGFGVYVNRGVSTKAGKTGELTTATLQEADGGFGVFGYYGNGALYNESSKPDFMYNEVVTYAAGSGKWEYHPVKYWPNEFGTAASSEAVDRLSFFAYAPYAEVIPSTGIVTATGEAANTGIIGLSRNIAAGDPMVMYSASLTPGAGVDLCWGVSKNGLTESVDGSNNHVAAGAPYIDVVKLKKGAKIEYDFRHALSAINVTIDAAVDATTPGTAVDADTKIFIRSVSFEGLATKGALNLNSTAANGPLWTDYSGAGVPLSEVLTVYDGRRDGKEGVEGAVASNETPLGLNPVLIQDKPYSSAELKAGVTKDAVNLFNSTTTTAPVFVIPSSEPLKVTLVYDVETKDDKLSTMLSDGTTHGSTVENVITKAIQIGTSDVSLEAGKKYTIALHIGLTSVKFDASVTTWTAGSDANVDLPQNN